MPDLRDQIRTYLEETSEPIGPDDVYDLPVGGGKVRPLTRFPIRNRVPTGVLVAAAVAAVALLVVGLPLLLARSSGPDPAADPATTTMPSTTTTIVVESAPTTIQQVTVDVAASIVPGLGTLTWERIDGDETSLPTNIAEFVDGRYVSFDNAGRWTSTDAVTWTLEETGTFGDYRWFYERDGWAIGSDEDRSELLRRDGDTWVPVEFPPASIPAVSGVTWRQHPQMPLESDGTMVAVHSAWGEVGWGDVFGVFEVNCGEPEPCEMQPYGMWDSYSQVVRIENPDNGSVLAQAEIVVEGDEARLVDDKTGELLLTITADPAAYPIERIVDELQRNGGGMSHQGSFVSTDDGATWEWVTFPWRAHAEVVVVPDGGFAAFEFDYRWDANPVDPLVYAVVWTSTDGLTWTDNGPPAFETDGAEYVSVRSTDDRLIGTAITGHDDMTGMEIGETYVSTNGLDWQPVDLPFPSWFDETETSFGTVISAMPQSRHQFWISTDGGSVWHEVEGPPGSHEPTGPGGGGAAGDVLFVSFGSDEGPRTLWIGRFVP